MTVSKWRPRKAVRRDEKMALRAEGAQACREGKLRNSCPYRTNAQILDRMQWMLGFDCEAARERSNAADPEPNTEHNDSVLSTTTERET
jgi:ribosome modulation factor